MYRKWFITCFITIQLLESLSAEVTCVSERGETNCDLIINCTVISSFNTEDFSEEDSVLTLSECYEEKNMTVVINNWFDYENHYTFNFDYANKIRNVIFKKKNVLLENSITLVYGKFIGLEKCEYVDLSNNNVKQIGNLTFTGLFNLKFLNLSRNNIENIQDKMFCTFYDTFLYNSVLDLSFNKIELFNDSPFSCTPVLTHLYLQHNEIRLLSQQTFNNLNELTTLHLNDNKLRQLNSSLIPLHNLMYLDLSHNLLTNITESDFVSLTHLRVINVSYNSIVSISSCFFVRAYLETIDLKHNENLDISNELFLINNTFVNFLDVSKIMKIDTDDIRIKNYSITAISKGSLIDLKCTTEINLSCLNISFINNYIFSELDEIRIVNVSRNSISNIETAVFSGATQISILDLSYNRITNLYFLKSCLENITILYVNNNYITSLQAMLFAAQTKLTKLDISMNRIANVEQYALPLSSLQYLNMSGNNLTGIIKRDIFSPAKYLKYLDLSHMKFTAITENALIDMPNIIKLDLSNNNLGNLSTMPSNLQELYLSKNHITSFEILKKNFSSSFLILDVSSNPINTEVNMSNFEWLLVANLSNIGLRNISNHIFPDRLNKLYLETNNITDLAPGSFENLKDLQILNISYNFIKKLRYGSFKGLVSLQVLDLSYNIIEIFDVHVLHDCNRLKHLYLDYNKIVFLDIDNLVKFVPKITILSIGDNALECKDVLNIKHRQDLNIHITSIHQVSNDDNIHGIRCGSIENTSQVLATKLTEDAQNKSSTEMQKVYCWLIILSLILVALAFYIIYKYQLNSRNGYNNNLPLVHISNDRDINE